MNARGFVHEDAPYLPVKGISCEVCQQIRERTHPTV
jgi:hypothetical protein